MREDDAAGADGAEDALWRRNGAKPWEVKLCGWKLVAAMMEIAPRGTAIFHQVARCLVWASTFTPRKFTATKIAIRKTATMKPLVVRVPFAFRIPGP